MESENASGNLETYLPQGVIEDILSRLPVKSLLKLRRVSKSWRALIDSERFIKIHLKKSAKDASLSCHRMILSVVRYPQTRVMHSSWRSLLNEPDLFVFDDLLNIQLKSMKLVGCCNGLVCFLLNGNYFFLWNPSTRKCNKLPDVDDRLSDKIISQSGFGYDESNNDYKVLAFIFCNKNTPNHIIGRVFSLKTNSWKSLKIEDDSLHHFGGSGKFASGNLHWNRAVNGLSWEIVSFDFKCEAFGIVAQPSFSEGASYQSLGMIEGCLSALCEYRHSHSDIWVMKQYGLKESWVKVVTLPLHRFPELNILSTLLFCRGPNGEVVLFYRSGFLIYNPRDNFYQYFPTSRIGSVQYADCYVESLVSLQDSGAEQGQ